MMKTRLVLEGIGTAILLVPCNLFLFDSQNHQLYHHGLPVTHLIGGLLVDLLGVSVLATFFLVAIQHLPKPVEKMFEALFAGLMLWSIVYFAIQVLFNVSAAFIILVVIFGWVAILILLLQGILACSFPRFGQFAVNAIRLTIASLAFSAVWIVPQLFYLALVRQPDDNAVSFHPSATTHNSSHRRIVWVLFDELSYQQTFANPASGIQLPNFDRLHAESVSFSNLKPVGYYTETVIPSLFLGRSFDKFRSPIDGKLSYKDEPLNRWFAYDPNATLFGVAQRNGWSTGVDGWYIPYCHILYSVLDACSWEPYNGPVFPTEAYGASEEKSVLANAAVLPNMFLAPNNNAQPASAHVQEFRNVMARTHALIENGNLDFVFLHLPVPHPPGLYDRKRHMLRPDGTYLDNLVLADDTLGILLQEIDATPSARRTTVIISSDHSWRIPIWKPQAGWRPEEDRVSGGRFDDRPVLLIRFPGQNVGAGNDVNAALPELLEHDIIAGMLLGKINNPKDLATFLAQRGH